jgi:hypothetical protein
MLEQGFTYMSIGRPAVYGGSIGKKDRRTVSELDPPRGVLGPEIRMQPDAVGPEA